MFNLPSLKQNVVFRVLSTFRHESGLGEDNDRFAKGEAPFPLTYVFTNYSIPVVVMSSILSGRSTTRTNAGVGHNDTLNIALRELRDQAKAFWLLVQFDEDQTYGTYTAADNIWEEHYEYMLNKKIGDVCRLKFTNGNALVYLEKQFVF